MPTLPKQHREYKPVSGWNQYHQGKTSKQRGYGGAWQKARSYILHRDNGLCIPCMTAGRITQATEVDHITPKAKGGNDDYANLQAICTPCHKAKTGADKRAP